MNRILLDLVNKIRRECLNRCSYCLTPQELVSQKLEIEHIVPKSKGGTNQRENLCLACAECNRHKAAKTHGFDLQTGKTAKIFNPRRQHWRRHFKFNPDATEIIGKTVCGRATVRALQMNSDWQTTARSFWKLTDKFPPKEFY